VFVVATLDFPAPFTRQAAVYLPFRGTLPASLSTPQTGQIVPLLLQSEPPRGNGQEGPVSCSGNSCTPVS